MATGSGAIRFSPLICAALFSVLIAGCAEIQLGPPAGAKALELLTVYEYPSFSGVGAIVAEGGGLDFSGSILLAIDGGRYRLEILDPFGRGALAVAGDENQRTQMDTITGERISVTGQPARFIELDGVHLPVMALMTLVTGSPPPYKKLLTVNEGDDGHWLARVSDPAMELYYSGRLEKVALTGGADDEKIVITLGKIARDQAGFNVSAFHIDFGRGKTSITVEWKKVRRNVKFADGFFDFTEEVE